MRAEPVQKVNGHGRFLFRSKKLTARCWPRTTEASLLVPLDLLPHTNLILNVEYEAQLPFRPFQIVCKIPSRRGSAPCSTSNARTWLLVTERGKESTSSCVIDSDFASAPRNS